MLSSLGGRSAARPDFAAWDRLLDSDLACGAVEECPVGGGSADEGMTLKSVLSERMLEPLAALGAADADADADTVAALAAAASYSAILFGPPGTAKSTVVDAIARRLGWGFVTIDTSLFLSAGLSNVAARISEIFAQLMQLEEVVVLFDENRLQPGGVRLDLPREHSGAKDGQRENALGAGISVGLPLVCVDNGTGRREKDRAHRAAFRVRDERDRHQALSAC